jgi:uncharacterized protein (UPF0276 family)
MASHFFADVAAIEPLAEAYPLVLHEVGMSIGTARAGHVDRATVGRVLELVTLARPKLLSEHLAMTRSPSGIDLGHLCPIWRTEAALAMLVDRVRAWQDVFGIPIALENIAAPFEIPDADMSESEFFSRLVDATGCGLLLDLTNLALDAKNFGFEAATRLSRYPLESVWQVHLAGGRRHGDWHLDSHSEPVDDVSYTLLEALRPRAPLQAIVIERDDNLPPLEDLVREARRARHVWEGT